jgi:hypothetical protein
LEDFPFDETILSCNNKGQFPDLAIRISPPNELFTGGELIELKDSISYSVSSFNSTIPTGKKAIEKVVKVESGSIALQMLAAGDDIFSLPIREVFYLIRGKKKDKIKICLVHGSFFETVPTNNLISQSFSQVLDERLSQQGIIVEEEVKKLLLDLFSEQNSFNKVRNVDKASVKLRFRIMTEVKAEGNILDSRKYPQIGNDTINFILPAHDDEVENELSFLRMQNIFGHILQEHFSIFKLKHHFNSYFLVFQQSLQ